MKRKVANLENMVSGHCTILLPPANKVCEGYVFTSVCLSTGGCLPQPPGRHPLLRQTPPWADTPSPGKHPPGQTPLCPVHAGIHTPLPSACWDTPPCPVHARQVYFLHSALKVFVVFFLLSCRYRSSQKKSSIPG